MQTFDQLEECIFQNRRDSIGYNGEQLSNYGPSYPVTPYPTSPYGTPQMSMAQVNVPSQPLNTHMNNQQPQYIISPPSPTTSMPASQAPTLMHPSEPVMVSWETEQQADQQQAPRFARPHPMPFFQRRPQPSPIAHHHPSFEPMPQHPQAMDRIRPATDLALYGSAPLDVFPDSVKIVRQDHAGRVQHGTSTLMVIERGHVRLAKYLLPYWMLVTFGLLIATVVLLGRAVHGLGALQFSLPAHYHSIAPPPLHEQSHVQPMAAEPKQNAELQQPVAVPVAPSRPLERKPLHSAPLDQSLLAQGHNHPRRTLAKGPIYPS